MKCLALQPTLVLPDALVVLSAGCGNKAKSRKIGEGSEQFFDVYFQTVKTLFFVDWSEGLKHAVEVHADRPSANAAVHHSLSAPVNWQVRVTIAARKTSVRIRN